MRINAISLLCCFATGTAHAADDSADHPFQNAVPRLDMDSGREQRYSFAPTDIAEEHIVVPKPGRSDETASWLLGTVLDTQAQRTRLVVFDAAAVADGPVFAAELPYALPLGFHGNFAPAAWSADTLSNGGRRNGYLQPVQDPPPARRGDLPR